MKRFLVKSFRTFILIVALHAIVLLFFANGRIDNFYLRFTSPKQTSLILGNSRSAQGLLPHVIDSALNLDPGIFNYSFTVNRSPYGPYYEEAIFRKLLKSDSGIFIIAVDPWSLSLSPGEKEEVITFEEKETIPYAVRNPNRKYNVEYLMQNYFSGWGDMIIANTLRTDQTILHENGWLEVNVLYDEDEYLDRIKSKSKIYNEYARNYRFSQVRLDYLKNLIEKLSMYGRVYLVRLPIHTIISSIEEEHFSSFDKSIRTLSKKLNVPYYRFSTNDSLYTYTDGNHLYKESGALVSKMLADSINTENK